MNLLSKRDIVLIMIVFFVVGCTDSAKESLMESLKKHQNSLDEKIERTAQKGDLYQDSLAAVSKTNNDTIVLAKELVYLRNAKFLLETQYDSVEITIRQLNSNRIKVEEAKSVLEGLKNDLTVLESKYKID
jgi:prefoldin subunit 5